MIDNFRADYDKYLKGDYSGWTADRDGALAATILLDQFSRQFFRGSGEAFKADPIALKISQKLMAESRYDDYKAFEKLFILLPFMHAEDIKCLDKCVEELTKVNDDMKARQPEFIMLGQPYFGINVNGGINHSKTIRKFGRYPTRNKALGRESTPEEIAYLENAQTYGQ